MPYFNPLTKEQYQDILKDIGTDEETIKRDVKYLIEWLEQTEYLPSVKDEVFLTSALVQCKNSMEKTKNFLDYYYSRRTLGADMFACRDPCDNEMKRTLQMFLFVPLPGMTPEGYRILVDSNGERPNLPKMSYILSAWQIQLEIMMKSEPCKGYVFISDIPTFSFSQSTMYMAEFKKIADLFSKTTKTRFKEMYVLNASSATNSFLNTMKPLLSGKIFDRIEAWTKKPEDFAEIFPKNILPSDFGGDELPLAELKKAWLNHVMKSRDWFIAEQNVKADLSKRPKNDALSNELTPFGLSGTFRKINLD